MAAEQFRAECLEHFSFLISDYGFKEERFSSRKRLEPFEVRLISANTRIIILGTHWGTGVDVRVGRLSPEPWEEYGSYALEDLIMIRSPSLSLIQAHPINQVVQLRHYADALRLVGADLLQGDFAILPKLHEAIVKRRQAR